MNDHIDPIEQWLGSTASMEVALTGSLFTHNSAVGQALAAELQPEHFADEILGTLWSRVRATALRGDIVDIRTVLQGGASVVFGGGMTLEQAQAHFLAVATLPSLVGQYCRIIKCSWALRRLLDQGEVIRAAVAGEDAQTIVEKVLSVVDEIRDVTLDRNGTRRGSIGGVADALAEAARAMASGNVQRPPSTGLITLDRHLPMRGLAPGSLIIMAGRTGMGKTMLATSIAGKVAGAGHGVAVYSLEVPAAEIAARLISERIGPRGPCYGDILAGHVTEDELDDIDRARDDVRVLPLHVDDTPALSMADIMVSARREAARLDRIGKQLRLIVVDHAQIVKASARYQGNRVGELGEIANGAKVLAKQLGCTVVLGCQVNRANEARDDKRPTLADLRASGEIEEAADAVLMAYREAYYLRNSPKFREQDLDALNEYDRVKNHVEIGIEKARQGSTGRVTLWCDPGRSAVNDLSRVAP